MAFRFKVVGEFLKIKPPIPEAERVATGKRGRPRMFREVEIPVKIRLTWSAKLADQDRADRERMLERLRKKLDKPYQLKAAI